MTPSVSQSMSGLPLGGTPAVSPRALFTEPADPAPPHFCCAQNASLDVSMSIGFDISANASNSTLEEAARGMALSVGGAVSSQLPDNTTVVNATVTGLHETASRRRRLGAQSSVRHFVVDLAVAVPLGQLPPAAQTSTFRTVAAFLSRATVGELLSSYLASPSAVAAGINVPLANSTPSALSLSIAGPASASSSPAPALAVAASASSLQQPLSIGAWIGVAIAACAAMICCVLIACIVYRRSSRASRKGGGSAKVVPVVDVQGGAAARDDLPSPLRVPPGGAAYYAGPEKESGVTAVSLPAEGPAAQVAEATAELVHGDDGGSAPVVVAPLPLPPPLSSPSDGEGNTPYIGSDHRKQQQYFLCCDPRDTILPYPSSKAASPTLTTTARKNSEIAFAETGHVDGVDTGKAIEEPGSLIEAGRDSDDHGGAGHAGVSEGVPTGAQRCEEDRYRADAY